MASDGKKDSSDRQFFDTDSVFKKDADVVHIGQGYPAMDRKDARAHKTISGGAIFGAATAFGAMAGAGTGALPPISVTCSAASGIDAERAADMCGGFLQALGVAYPDRIFVVGSMHPPAMEVVVIRASEIEVGLNLTWHVPDGASVPGRPFQMSVMDRKIDLGRLTSLYQNFLGHNPLPF